METLTMLSLSEEEKALLLDVVVQQRYASELVSSELTDIETGQKNSEESRVRMLNNLLVRLHKAGY
ncbi:antirepressor AbbA [Pseudalkalibacillus decolorationis]|uniref:antirepressor AbbA n=1 Tax=Pseudalkalibacillus decolorationis TaxID=163879 RepID=UPI0021497F0B|nr:antirepressor AbbA [Pseudalkalibacillus decolorationis]